MIKVNADTIRARLKREGWERPICELVEILLKAIAERDQLVADLEKEVSYGE